MKKEPIAVASAPAGLVEHAKQRSRDVVAKLRTAMKTIEAEIDVQEGIYPLNGGKLTQAELCRRAGISNVTLSTSAHRDTTHKMVEEWLVRIKSATITGRKTVRRAVTDRADKWKNDLNAIAQNYRLAELEKLDMKRKIAKLEEENAALRKLIETAGASKVVVLPTKKK